MMLKHTEGLTDKHVTLIIRLLKWRIVLQWIGAVIMVPAVILGLTMNFGWVSISLAEPLLWAIMVAIVPLLGSIGCTIAVHYLKDLFRSQTAKEREKALAETAEENI